MNQIEVAVRWRLHGPAGPEIDGIVGLLASLGMTVEVIDPGTAYRVDGDGSKLAEAARGLETASVEGLKLEPERPPTGRTDICFVVAPSHAYRRVAFVHGSNPATLGFIARAIDARLQIAPAGLFRWGVSGSTEGLLAWGSAHVHRVPVEDVMSMWGITAEAAREEDTNLPPMPTIQVSLPDRKKIVEEIVRDPSGQIVRLVSVETDA